MCCCFKINIDMQHRTESCCLVSLLNNIRVAGQRGRILFFRIFKLKGSTKKSEVNVYLLHLSELHDFHMVCLTIKPQIVSFSCV